MFQVKIVFHIKAASSASNSNNDIIYTLLYNTNNTYVMYTSHFVTHIKKTLNSRLSFSENNVYCFVKNVLKWSKISVCVHVCMHTCFYCKCSTTKNTSYSLMPLPRFMLRHKAVWPNIVSTPSVQMPTQW